MTIQIRTYLASLTIFLAFQAKILAQEIDVIPPSPNAASIQEYGNTNVNLYTGAVGINIPFYTINDKDLSLPISLSYSGSNGITVPQIASWVGLGWSLKAGGAVSRTIMGLADDAQNTGYLNCGALPQEGSSLNDYQPYADYLKDGQPDKFFFNVNGYSGTFYIKKDKSILQVPESNVLIDPTYGSWNKLESFTITTPDGMEYFFDDTETIRSVTLGQDITVDPTYNSTWYLTRIKNMNGTAQINFQYTPTLTTTYNETVNNVIINEAFDPHYTETETQGFHLSKIYTDDVQVIFSHGEERCDLLDDNVLSSIEVYSSANYSLLKKYTFDYSYFTATGVVPISDTCTPKYIGETLTDGDFEKRLKLDAITEWDSQEQQAKPSYQFTYETNVLLPSRHSYSQDYWGFYNGKPNSTPEPVQRVDEDDIINSSFSGGKVTFGKADKNANAVFGKACILTDIKYPTGGSTTFEYEANTANEPYLQNPMPRTLSAIMDEGEANAITIDINLVNEPFAKVVIGDMPIINQLTDLCNIIVTIEKNGNETEYNMYNSHNTEQEPLTLFLDEGAYTISFRIDNTGGTCFIDGVILAVSWETEINSVNKEVGGVRLSEMIDDDGNGRTLIKTYSYTDENGISTGSLVTLPKYGFLNVDYIGGQPVPLSWVRTCYINIPLATTQGNHVGYGRVTVINRDEDAAGKTEYYFTSPKDHGDFVRGHKIYEGDDKFVSNGKTYYTYVYPPADSRDWQRGLLYKKIDYASNGAGTFKKVSKKFNTYTIYGPISVDNEIVPGGLDDYGEITGLKTDANLRSKHYSYSGGHVQLMKKRQVTYSQSDPTDSLESITEYYYDVPDFYKVTRERHIGSNGEHRRKKTKYPYQKDSISGLPSSTLAAYQAMIDKNNVNQVIGIENYKDGTQLSTQRSYYKIDQYGNIVGDKTLKSFGNNGLEEEIDYLAYDVHGNIKSYKDRSGYITSFLWGYGCKYPIAKIINASPGEVFYTSFEETGTGTLGDAKTGKSAYVGASYTVSDIPSGTNLVMTYWYKKNGKWNFQDEITFSSTITVSGADRLDEIRVYPQGAKLQTFTYEPNVGLLDTTDPNNITTYYHYDTQQRLHVIKDQDEKILNQYLYHYQGQ